MVAHPPSSTTKGSRYLMSDESPVSPTGLPMLPVKLMPWAAALVALAGGLQFVFPPHTVAFKVCQVVQMGGAALGIVSAGARKV